MPLRIWHATNLSTLWSSGNQLLYLALMLLQDDRWHMYALHQVDAPAQTLGNGLDGWL
jgi:hypothetical protein